MKRIALFIVAGCALVSAPNRGLGQDVEPESMLAALWPLPPLADPVPVDPSAEDVAEIVGGLLDLRWEALPAPAFRYAPPAAHAPPLVLQGAVDPPAHRHTVKVGLDASRTPSALPLQLEAALASRDDSVRAHHNVENAAATAKLMLPAALHAWYVKMVAQTRLQQSGQLTALVGRSRQLRSGTRIEYSLGFTRREDRRRPPAGSNVLHGVMQWHWSERLGLGIRFNYDTKTRGIDALMSLDMQSRVLPSP